MNSNMTHFQEERGGREVHVEGVRDPTHFQEERGGREVHVEGVRDPLPVTIFRMLNSPQGQ